MISVQKAQELILTNAPTTVAISVALEDALGLTTAKPILSPIALPLFNQSAMDGYGIHFSDYFERKNIEIINEIPAGYDYSQEVTRGFGVKIYTGAKVPIGVDTIVVQEEAKENNNLLSIDNHNISLGNNIRKTGSIIKKGECAIPEGTRLTPPLLGYLSSLGIQTVEVYSKPKVNIIITGSELTLTKNDLELGKLYESNSVILKSALELMGIKNVSIEYISDNYEKLLKAIESKISQSEILILTGGISVGKYDLVHKSLKDTGVEEVFYKIKQKPGKPLFFGKYKNNLVFALPGNPAAVVTCFYNYVYPAVHKLTGNTSCFLQKLKFPVAEIYSKKAGISVFLKAKLSGNKVYILDGQESHSLKSYLEANAMVYLPEETEKINPGDNVDVYIIPNI